MPLGGSNLARLHETSHLMESPPQERLPCLSIPRARSNSSSAIISDMEPQSCWIYAPSRQRLRLRMHAPDVRSTAALIS